MQRRTVADHRLSTLLLGVLNGQARPQHAEFSADDVRRSLSVLSNPTRFAIFLFLKGRYDRAFTRLELQDELQLNPGNLSNHLYPLLNQRILQARIDGQTVRYRLNDAFLRALVDFASVDVSRARHGTPLRHER